MKRFAVYQFDAHGDVYRLVDVVTCSTPAQAATAVKLANCIFGTLYVREADADGRQTAETCGDGRGPGGRGGAAGGGRGRHRASAQGKGARGVRGLR